MAALSPAAVPFGWPAAPFSLRDTDGGTQTLDTLRGQKGLVLVFMCNHCPYVRAIVDRMADDFRTLAALGYGTAGICSNDAAISPRDGFPEMVAFARDHALPFPYLHDATQEVARAYDAACTPDFYGFDADLRLRYRGRLDDSGRDPKPGSRRELVEAMTRVAETGEGPSDPVQAIGCSIKWKTA